MIYFYECIAKELKEFPCSNAVEAEVLRCKILEALGKELGYRNPFWDSCPECNNILNYLDAEETHAEENNTDLEIFSIQCLGCIKKTEPHYLEFLKEQGVPVQKIFDLLGIKSLFDFSEEK